MNLCLEVKSPAGGHAGGRFHPDSRRGKWLCSRRRRPWLTVAAAGLWWCLAAPLGAQDGLGEAERGGLRRVSRDVIDKLKEQVDEWGTLALSPPMLVPPAFFPAADDSNKDPQRVWPFELKESKPPAGTNPFTLAELYAEMNKANGSILFGQRTQTRTQLEANLRTDEVARAVLGKKLKVLAASQTKVTEGNLEKQTLVQGRLDAALRQEKQAWADMREAAASVTRETQAVEAARRTLLTAQKATVGLSGEDLEQAQMDIIPAEENLRSREAQLKLANTRLSNAQIFLTDAGAAADLARKEVVRVKSEQLELPDASTLPVANAQPDVVVSPPASSALLAAAGGTEIEQQGKKGTAPDFAVSLAPEDSAAQSAFPPLQRLNAAAATLTVKNILSFLGKPEAAVDFNGKRLLFAVSMLSVNPGWRTQRNFKAVIDAQLTLDLSSDRAPQEAIREILNSSDYPAALRKSVARQYPRDCTAAQRDFFNLDEPSGSGRTDLSAFRGFFHNDEEIKDLFSEKKSNIVVTAVSPMVDAQNLDLSSSIARQDEIALFLSYSLAQAGSAGAANFFTSWVKSRRKDVATRTTVATANSYSLGDHFGFEIGTRLIGLDDSDAKGGKAAQTLERQTVPVLFIIGIPPGVARPILQQTGNGQLKVRVPGYKLAYSTRWARHSHGFWSFLKPNRTPGTSAEEILKNAGIRDTAFFAAGVDRKKLEKSEVGKVMGFEYEALTGQLYGFTYNGLLPGRWLVDHADGLRPVTDGLRDEMAQVPVGEGIFQVEEVNFAGIGALAEVRIRGKDLHLLDGSKAVVAGGGLELAPESAMFQSGSSLTVPVRALQRGNGRASLVIPYRVASEGRNAFEVPVVYRIEEPSLSPWPQGEEKRFVRTVPASAAAGAPRTGVLRVTLRGQGLDRLEAPRAISRNPCTVRISPSPEAAVMLLELNFPDVKVETDSVRLVFGVTGDAEAPPLHTGPLQVQFISSN